MHRPYRLVLICLLVALSTNPVEVFGQRPRVRESASLVTKGGTTATHVSLDGKYLLFTDWSDNQLYIRDLSAGTDRQLTHRQGSAGGQYAGGAIISPDNQNVAYNWYSDTLEIRVAQVSGGEWRRVDSGWALAWSPDSRRLLVVKASSLEAKGDIGFLNVSTGQFHRIGSVQASTHARLSPDGSQIVLSELSDKDPTQRDVRLMDSQTGKSRLLLSGPTDDYSPDWASDGRSILFLSDRGGRPGLWRLQLNRVNGQPQALHDLLDGDLSIVGVVRPDRVLVYAEDIGGSDSYSGKIDWDSGQLLDVQLLKNPPYKGSRRAVPSPDGTLVAFLRRGRGYRVRPGWQIPVVQSFVTGQDRVYPTALTLRDAPFWYPDQRGLLFPMPPEGAVGDSIGRVWRFVRLDLETGKYQEVGWTDSSGLVRLAGLTNKSLFYLLAAKRVMRLDWRTGISREVFGLTGDGQISDAAVLDDGERIAFALYGQPTTIAVAEPGKEWIRIGQLESTGRPQLVWCSDRSSILTSGTLKGKEGVWRIPLDGREPQRLTIDRAGINEVRLSENGKRLAFTQRIDRPREVWSYDVQGVGLVK